MYLPFTSSISGMSSKCLQSHKIWQIAVRKERLFYRHACPRPKHSSFPKCLYNCPYYGHLVAFVSYIIFFMQFLVLCSTSDLFPKMCFRIGNDIYTASDYTLLKPLHPFWESTASLHNFIQSREKTWVSCKNIL